MGLKFVSTVLFSFLILLPLVTGLRIDVEVAPWINGTLSYMEKTSGPVQTFSLTWENMGSVGCRSRARLEFYDTKLVYIAWSDEKELWPGAVADLRLYTRLPPGNHSFIANIQHCYKTFSFGPYSIESFGHMAEEAIEITSPKTFKDHVEIGVRSAKSLENILAIPAKYPDGWIFESSVVEQLPANRTKTMRLEYEPSIWKESNLTVEVMTLDGKYIGRKTFMMKIEKGILEEIAEFFRSLLSFLR